MEAVVIEVTMRLVLDTKFQVPLGHPGDCVLCHKRHLWKLICVTRRIHRKEKATEHQWVTGYNCKGNRSLNWLENGLSYRY